MDKLRWVLDRHEQDIVRLNDYLLARLDGIVPIATVMNDLDWSRYRVLSTLDSLINDLAVLQPSTNEDAKYRLEKKEIKVNHSVQINTLALEYQYRKRSIAWIMLLEMLTEQVDSYDNFADRHNVSVAAVRAAKQKIQAAFLEQDISVSKNNRIVGNEVVVRSFFMQLMRYYHAQIEQTMVKATPQAHLVTDQLVDEVLHIYGLQRNMTSQNIVSLQVLIWLVRVQNGHYLHDQDLPKILTDQVKWPKDFRHLSDQLIMLMREFVDLPKHVLQIEASFAVLALFTSGLGAEVPQVMLRPEVKQHLVQFKEILQTSYQSFFKQVIPLNVQHKLVQDTLSGNLRTLYFMKDLVQNSVDIGVLESNFPIHARYTCCLLQALAKLWMPNQENKFIKVMFEEYFNAIIMNLSPQLILPAVRVAIGFAYHPGMENFICERLQGNRNINFEFVPMGARADMYISDIAVESEINVPGYIWNIFPDNHTIDHFLQDAVQITNKYFKNFECSKR